MVEVQSFAPLGQNSSPVTNDLMTSDQVAEGEVVKTLTPKINVAEAIGPDTILSCIQLPFQLE